MEQAASTKTSKTASGKERRAHPRYPVSVKLDIMIQGLGQRKAEARDFCQGGLLIAFDPGDPLPATTDFAGTICLITLHIDKDDYRLRAKIAHADADSAGLAFLNPDGIALQALQNHARIESQPSDVHTAKAASPARAPSPASSTSQRQPILTLCNAVIQNHIQPVITAFLDNASDRLFHTAKTIQEPMLQNLHFQALEILNNNRNLLTNTFSSHINKKLQANYELIAEPELDEDYQDESLALISDKEFNIWLASSKVMHKIESEFPQLIGTLERRLSEIYQQDVDRKNNPYGPSLFVQAFQNAMELLEMNHQVLPTCYESFKHALLKSAQEIYTNLNQVLINNGILPDNKAIYQAARKNTKNDQQTNKAPEPKTAQAASPETGEAETDTPGVDNAAGNSGEEHITPQNLYQIVGEIRQLQSLLQQQTGNTPVIGQQGSAPQLTATSNPPAALSLPAYSTAEALDVISKFQPGKKTIQGNGQSLTEFRNQLNQYLLTQSNEPGQKTLSTQHHQIIDVTENVFTSLLNDLQVAQSVRPWLERLAIPVMKMALLDENIFTDKNHVVRSVINKLAELEVLASAENEEEQAAVQQAFNWVINLVNNEFDGTTNVYSRAAQQLDILIKVQQQSFERNLKTVVAEAIREERDQSTAQAEETTDASPATVEASDESWLRMVSRLKENHWVLFDTFTNEPKRLKVAWIAPRKGKFVFVNVMGRKERICTSDKLAELFKSGEAIVLDGADDPAMDRAQYTMLQKLHQQLLHQSTHDELTGLINRREFTNCMRAALDDAVQNNTKHAVCYLDLDDFKVINNNYGYDAGDHLLKQFVELVKTCLGEDPVLSRIGADHFALMLRGTSMDEAVETIEQIMDALLEYHFEWQDNRMTVTISAGIAVINANTDNMIDLLHSAESSCSMAKESGGNQIQIYHAGASRVSRRKKETEWAVKIDKALEESALYLRCQKIIPIQAHLDQRPHYEILLGISDEAGGNSDLDTFIKAAEHHNRMLAVDRWVIENTFQWLVANEDTISDISLFTINLSGQSLNNENLIEFIYQQVSKTSVPIERICFEITETAGVSNLSDAADFIQTIKSTGCQFALDDFGSGMSSYAYLKNLPVDYLKIDGVFIKEITSNQNDFAVVKSICEIGHFMDKTVIAEFVQDEASLKMLKQMGVDYGQGYGIAKPHKLDDLLY